jgi:hypothetical protein
VKQVIASYPDVDDDANAQCGRRHRKRAILPLAAQVSAGFVKLIFCGVTRGLERVLSLFVQILDALAGAVRELRGRGAGAAGFLLAHQPLLPPP